MEIKYCINCEAYVPVEFPIEGHSIIQFVPDEGTQEISWCEGEFTECAITEVDPDWGMKLVEPTPAEMAIMNGHAEELYRDFEGEYYAS